MPEVVFYAWQSDRPANVNKNFIRNCIERAVAALNAELGIEDAVRADQDTQNVAGDVNVAEVIFDKIDACRAFVADVTTITPAGAARPCPNPNVLVEYGRASVRPGSGAVITVFNQAFGNWETERPFDLRHRRRPLLYTLPVAHTDEQRRAARGELVAELTDALRAVLRTAPTTATLPDLAAFDPLRHLYAETHYPDEVSARTLGFWCALVPYAQQVSLRAPWDHRDLFNREPSFRFRLGNGEINFETMDSPLAQSRVDFQPMQGGARFVKYHRYSIPGQPQAAQLCHDVIGVYLYSDGRLVLAVRTDNFYPGPHLNIRWIMADLANSLRVMDRTRQAAGRPNAPYALLAELRFDAQAGAELRPIDRTEWRLGNLQDDTGLYGPPVRVPKIVIGPIPVGDRAGFPEVLQTAYTDIMTSVSRRPEPELAFEGA